MQIEATTRANRAAERSVGRGRWIVLAFLALATVPSCTKDAGTADPSGAGGTTIEDLRQEVLMMKEEAQDADAAKYAAPDYAKAEKYLTQAEELLEQLKDDPQRAPQIKSKLSQARSNFKTARNNADANRKEYDKVEKIRKEYDELLAKKDEEKSNFRELDPEGWARASEKYAEANTMFADGDHLKASRRFSAALQDLKSSLSRAEQSQDAQARALAARTRMEETKKRALDAKGKEHAPGDITYAEEQERQAVRYLEAKDYQLAENYFMNAESSFAQALVMAQSRVAQTPPPGNGSGEPSDGGSREAGRETYEPAPEVTRVKPDVKEDDGLGLDVSTALLENLHGSPDLDRNGVLTLQYGIGQGPDLAKDVHVLGGEVDTHIRFSGIEGVGVADYLVAGNTRGAFLLKPVFKDRVQFDVEFQSQLNEGDTSTTFQLVIMSDGRAQNYYGSHFSSNILIVSGSKGTNQVPSLRKDYLQHVNKWLQRREPVRMSIKYIKKDDSEKGVIVVTFDGEEVCRKETDFYTKGQVGMLWSGAKFYLRDLKVRGVIDDEWAREFTGRKSQGGDEKKNEGDDFDF